MTIKKTKSAIKHLLTVFEKEKNISFSWKRFTSLALFPGDAHIHVCKVLQL